MKDNNESPKDNSKELQDILVLSIISIRILQEILIKDIS